MSEGKFARAERGKFSLKENEDLGKLCKGYKEEYDATVASNTNNVNYNDKMMKHTKMVGYITKDVREFYADLKNAKHNDPNLTSAVKLGKRCLDQVIKSETEILEPATKSKFRQPGGGRKATIPDVRQSLYDWFLDARGTLKARLPRSMFKSQCKLFYEQWMSQQSGARRKPNKWIRNWMREYNVSLRKPNKRFQIKLSDREERIFEYVKNILDRTSVFY